MRFRSASSDVDTPDLVPIMNLVTILIPFLLMSAQFVSLAVVDTTLPAISTVPGPGTDEGTLSLAIGSDGFVVRGLDVPRGGIPLACDGPCDVPDAWPYARLNEALAEVKRSRPSESTMVMAVEDAITFEVLLRAMDASRHVEGDRDATLFPGVVIAASGW